jgi:uncharacterized protein (DUF433 family)
MLPGGGGLTPLFLFDIISVMTKRYQNRITINPKVMVGKPVIKGTRITVELILRQLAQGITSEKILKNYPHLKREDIYAAIEYAIGVVEEETTYPLSFSHGKTKVSAR